MAPAARSAVQRDGGNERVTFIPDRRGMRKKEKTMTANTSTVPVIARKLKLSRVSCKPIPLVCIE
jgi:hypothetical protein